MSNWGRNGQAFAAIEPGRRRLGVWSLLCAMLAFILVISALIWMVNLPNGATDAQTDVATTVMLATYFIVAPILHITGIVLGIVGLSRGGESKLRCVIAIILNIALIGSGVFFGMIAASGIGAFT